MSCYVFRRVLLEFACRLVSESESLVSHLITAEVGFDCCMKIL